MGDLKCAGTPYYILLKIGQFLFFHLKLSRDLVVKNAINLEHNEANAVPNNCSDLTSSLFNMCRKPLDFLHLNSVETSESKVLDVID